jgi:hypothetical protein
MFCYVFAARSAAKTQQNITKKPAEKLPFIIGKMEAVSHYKDVNCLMHFFMAHRERIYSFAGGV